MSPTCERSSWVGWTTSLVSVELALPAGAAPPTDPLPARERPTRARSVLLGYLVVLSFLTYLDRACLASIKPQLIEELHLSMDQMSAIFSCRPGGGPA